MASKTRTAIASTAIGGAILAGALLVSSATAPPSLTLQPGQSVTIHCKQPLSFSGPSTDRLARCPQPSPTATSKPSSAAPTASLVPTPTPVSTPSPTPSASPAPSTYVSGPIVVTADNTTINGAQITGPMPAPGPLQDLGAGITATGTAAHPIANLTIENCRISGFRLSIYLTYVKNVTIQNCTLSDADYAGIALFNANGGLIQNNTVSRIGYVRTDFSSPAFSNNAYGIAAGLNADVVGQSQNVTIDHNTVTDVPLWMCINSHAGAGIVVTNNILQRCPRAVFMAGYSASLPVSMAKVDGNQISQAVTKSGGSTDIESVLYSWWTGGQITNNQIGTSYPLPYGYCPTPGCNSGVTIGGNTTPPG